MAKRRFRSRGRFSRVRRRRRFSRRRFGRTIKAVVRRMAEVKYAVVYNDPTSFDAATGQIVNLTPLIGQGVTKNTRIGNRIRYKFLQVRMYIFCEQYTASATDPITAVRLILFQPRLDFEPPSPPTNSDIFMIAGIQACFLSPIQNTNCRIIMDKSFAMSPNARYDETGAPCYKIIKKKVRINNNVNYRNNDSEDVQDPKDKYYMLLVTNNATPQEIRISTSICSRISFIDI